MPNLREVDLTQRFAVLLGAGASRDAGLPLTGELTQQVIAGLQQPDGVAHDTQLGNALNYICGALIRQRAETGIDPYAPLNIEDVVSSIRMLAERRNHEAAPFVDSWDATIERLDDHHVPDRAVQRLIDGMNKGLTGNFGTHDVSSGLVQAIRSAVEPGTGGIYRRLDAAVVATVTDILRNHDSVDYLYPIVELAKAQAGGLDVATLNYDTTIEDACADLGVTCSRGVTSSAAEEFSWDISGVRLYKLHGSVDWVRTEDVRDDEVRRVSSSRVVEASDERQRWASDPAIVLGTRDKLGSGDFVVDMLAEFSARLRSVDRMVVVGYSFADAHINALISRWINASPSRSLTVIDPGWDPDSLDGYAQDLQRDLVEMPRYGIDPAVRRE